MTIEVFNADKIITMNPSWPEGTAVAVRDGRILEVGTPETLQPWLNSVDASKIKHHDFTGKVILPGLIDPHLHPVMAAVLLPMHFVTALPWTLPWQDVPACPDPQSYTSRLRELLEASDQAEPFFTWGYHQSWHGEMSRSLMDELAGDRPMVVWHRSFHEVYLNTAMMAQLGITVEAIGSRQQIDYENGRFFEVGLGYAIGKLNRIIMSEDWISEGLRRLIKIVHVGGHTTVGDMAVGIFDYDMEMNLAHRILDQPDVPFRVMQVPHAALAARKFGGHEEVIAAVDDLQGHDTSRLRYKRHIKLFTDGAFFSQLAMLMEPGYVDGHHGEWLMTPEQFEETTRHYWQAGYAIHVHCTGDLGLELAIDTLEKMQAEKPRFHHGFTIEHFGFSTPEQVARLAALGGQVSANVYYLHELSERYSTHGVGVERAFTMSRLGTCRAEGLVTSVHSDFPMAPAVPLSNAWIAATRQNAAGRIVAPEEALSVYDALKAITIDAAKVISMEDEIGSIRAGKRADFTVVDRDPFDAGAENLGSINVLATVFEGDVHFIS